MTFFILSSHTARLKLRIIITKKSDLKIQTEHVLQHRNNAYYSLLSSKVLMSGFDHLHDNH